MNDFHTKTCFLHYPDMDKLYTKNFIDKYIFDRNFAFLKIKYI